MPRRPPRARRLVTAASWPFGIGLTSWHYMWRTTPLHRRETTGTTDEDSPPELPAGVPDQELQLPGDGVGPLFHRRYEARVREADLSADELIERIGRNLNQVAPTEFARFTKVYGQEDRMAVGDEYLVRMPGPWDGPVRVAAVTPTSFRLVTLDGHLEAGQIEFRASADGDDLVFTIESWARSGDRLSNLMYQHLRMAKEVQLHMWTSFLEQVARVAGGRLANGIDIDTRRVGHEDSRGGAGAHTLGDPRAREALDALHDKRLNFDLGDRSGFTSENGWAVDNYCERLPAEPPGPPVPEGSWQVARRLITDYEFADPAIVKAVYHPERSLEERDMLLEASFHGLRFRFGVRVGGVVDEARKVDGRPVHVWGWNYRTLQGHLEMGQMDFEVWKWADTGEVEFRTRRFSRHSSAGHPVVRLGVRLFGRRQQVKFAHQACQRMARLTAAALDGTEPGAGMASAKREIRVEPMPTAPGGAGTAGPTTTPH